MLTFGGSLDERGQLVVSHVPLNWLSTEGAEAFASGLAVIATLTPTQKNAVLILHARRTLSATVFWLGRTLIKMRKG